MSETREKAGCVCFVTGCTAGAIAAALHLGVIVYGLTAVIRLHQNPLVLPAVIATIGSLVFIAATVIIFSEEDK
jgi:hypothetical protein